MGYCANAGYIKGHNGYFNPYDSVTGYEVLAMVLRAVGYDQNHEFEGATWQTNVSALSTQLGILKQVKSTHYGDRLYEASRRDVVASLLFETAANVNMVNYTAMAGYNKYTNLVNNELNPTLGEKNFGLAATTRIVLGNQATGEKYTHMGVEAGTTMTFKQTADASKTTTQAVSMYVYPGTSITAPTGFDNADSPAGLKLDAKTGLSLFGHKTKAWYDARTGSTNSDGAQPTYAWFDKAELAKTVKAATTGEKIDKTQADDSATDGKIALAAKNAGFTIPTTAPAFYESVSFSRLTPVAADTAVTAGTALSTVWVLISNNDKKTVDVVIPVEVTAAQITKVDNWSTTKQITLDTKFDTGKVNTIDNQTAPIDQADVTSDPAGFVVGNKVIAVAITDRTDDVKNDGSTTVYWLDTVPFKTVTGKVVAYDYDAATDKATVTLDNGTVLKHTIIANTAISGKSGNYGVKTIEAFDNLTYEFQLDMQGNWLDAKPVYDTSFIYGTYLDYGTTLGSSSFTYKMVGVDLNGEVVTKEFTKYNLSGTAYTLGGDHTNDSMMGALGMPFHSTGDSNTGNWGSGLVKRDVKDDTTAQSIFYKGFIANGNLMDHRAQTLYDIVGIQSLGNDGNIYKNGASASTEDKVYDFKGEGTDGTKDTVIDKDDVKMGVALVTTDVVAAGTAAAAANPYLYMNEETKFIVVDGYGTDSLKPVVYNGISELLGNADSVTINTSIEADDGTYDGGRGTEILFTCQDYQYSNTGVISKKANVMILPKDALTYDNGSNLYFFHKVTSNVKDAGGDAYRFEAYQGTEKINVWVDDGYVDSTGGELQTEAGTGNNLAADKFLLLIDSGEKAADGQPIYTTKALAAAQNGAPASDPKAICFDTATAYKADTMNSQTALLGTDLVNVANAKVVNLDTDNGTIESMADLNHASSVCSSITVCVEYAEAGSKVVSAIYVVSITQ